MLQIIKYWEIVVREENPHGPVVTVVKKGEYEIQHQWTTPGTLDELKKRWRNHNKRLTVFNDRIVEDCGTQYGIHSYIEIREV